MVSSDARFNSTIFPIFSGNFTDFIFGQLSSRKSPFIETRDKSMSSIRGNPYNVKFSTVFKFADKDLTELSLEEFWIKMDFAFSNLFMEDMSDMEGPEMDKRLFIVLRFGMDMVFSMSFFSIFKVPASSSAGKLRCSSVSEKVIPQSSTFLSRSNLRVFISGVLFT